LLLQRQRHCNERTAREEAKNNPPKKAQRANKCTKISLESNPTVLVILDSDGNAKDPILVTSESKDEGDLDGLATCHYEMEMDEINDANEMVQFMEDATNNIISNEDDSSGTEDEIFECLLPLFLGPVK
jgi:hypothetical protein